MVVNKIRQLDTKESRKRSFPHNVAARIAAVALWKSGVLLVALVLGTSAVAVGVALHHRPLPPPGVVLEKLVALDDYHAAQAIYSFNFVYVVHHSFLFFTGESIHAVGSGTDDAIVNFSALTQGGVVPVGNSVTLLLTKPYLGTPVINMQQTTLSESGGLLTHLSHLIQSDPGDAEKVLEAAQSEISNAAVRGALISRAETNTRTFLARFLGRLGYTHITVIFG